MNTIFIETGYPMNYYVAIRIEPSMEYHQAYRISELGDEYYLFKEMEKEKGEFKEIPLEQVKEIIKNSDWNNIIQDNYLKAFTHKNLTK